MGNMTNRSSRRRQQHASGSRRDAIMTKTRRLENEVFWHVVAYLMAFWIAWPIMCVSVLVAQWDHYWFGPVAFALAPLQGFSNFCVYFRSHFSRWMKRRKRLQKRQSSIHFNTPAEGPRPRRNQQHHSGARSVGVRVKEFFRWGTADTQIVLSGPSRAETPQTDQLESSDNSNMEGDIAEGDAEDNNVFDDLNEDKDDSEDFDPNVRIAQEPNRTQSETLRRLGVHRVGSRVSTGSVSRS